MNSQIFIVQGLYLQGLPMYEIDLPYIRDILYNINQAEMATTAFPYLNEEIPITIVDKGLML